jgi:hypothetical protein
MPHRLRQLSTLWSTTSTRRCARPLPLPSPRRAALTLHIDLDNEALKVACPNAYPNALLARSYTFGRAVKGSALALSICSNQGTGDGEYGRTRDIHSLRIAVSGLFCHDVHTSASTRAAPA